MPILPEVGPDGLRRYGQWAGEPKGRVENPELCSAEIPDRPGFLYHQCSRKRGHGENGLFCKQHSKSLIGQFARIPGIEDW